MDKPLVSIIMPLYQAEKYIQETIESVKKQTYLDWELIVVDDGSKDRSYELAKKEESKKIKVIKMLQNGGPSLARNKALELAKGRYIAFLDADDRWKEDKLEKQISFMQQNNACFSYTSYEFIKDDGTKTGKVVQVPESLTYEQALKNTIIGILTVMIDTQTIPKEYLQMKPIKNEDTATWWSILRKGYIANGLQESLAYYRVANNSRSQNKLKSLKNTWRLYRREEGLSLFKSMYYHLCYTYHAIRKRI